MWRAHDGRETIDALDPGVCLPIPLGTHLQFGALPAVPEGAGRDNAPVARRRGGRRRAQALARQPRMKWLESAGTPHSLCPPPV
jgi:hypothetical protein